MRITSCVRREVRLELWQVVHVSRFWPTSTSAAPVSGSMNTTAVVHQEVALSVAVGAGHEDGVGDPVAEAAKQEVQEGHACLAAREARVLPGHAKGKGSARDLPDLPRPVAGHGGPSGRR